MQIKLSFFQLFLILTILVVTEKSFSQGNLDKADSLRNEGLLVPALMIYAASIQQNPNEDLSYKIASTSALLWTTQMRDTSFYFLNHALSQDSTLTALYDPNFLSLVDDPRWHNIENEQIRKYESKNGSIRNKTFAKQLFRMIIKDQGFMYAGNIERKKYIQNGGFFDSPAIFPVLAQEEKNMKENQKLLLDLLEKYGWPTSSQVTEYAAAGAALIINHSSFELRQKYFPLLEEAFKNGEAQPLRYAKMKDRLLVEQGKEQLYGTQIKFEDLRRELYPIENPKFVNKRRKEIGLGPLAPYLKARFDIDWDVIQEN